LIEALARAFQFILVYIKADQFSCRPNPLHELQRVTSVAHCAVGDYLAWARGQRLYYLCGKDGNVGAGRRLPLGLETGL
jgi:hypothetical protein